MGLFPFFRSAPKKVVTYQGARGGRKNKKGENDVHLCQLTKKVRTYLFVCFCFFVRFWAFLAKGSSKTRETKLSTFQKNSQGKYFIVGGDFFSGGISFDFFFFRLFCCVG
jgi:hypothetical protein